MELLCIAAVIIAILVLALVGAIHLIVLIFRSFDRPPAIREVPRPSNRQERSASLESNIEQAKLRSTLKMLSEFRDSELIDEETFQKLHHLISVRQHRLRSASSRPAPAAEAISEALPADVSPIAVAAVEPLKEATPAVVAQPRPRRTWGELLASFMEERHILWGELIGGLLIVGCSAALVLSLWQTLQQIPMFPFLILAALTAALFGVGRYTLRRWRLESTSRGLLAIALLLVPLNFMVLAGLSAKVTDFRIELATKFIAVPLFSWLVFRAGSLLFSEREAGLLALAIVGAAVSPLPVPRLFEPENLLWLLPTIWAVACFGAGVSIFLRGRWQDTEMTPQHAWEILGFLGLTTFPLAVALTFTGVWAGTHDADVMFVLHRLSLPIVLAGVPVAATGLMVQQRSKTGPLIIAGTCVALVGILVHGEALFTSWPQAEFLILVGLIIAVAWTAAALIFQIPLAHAAAMVGLTTAVVAAIHLTGPFSWPEVLTSRTGIALTGLSLFLAVVADQLRSRDLWNHGRVHAAFAAGLMTCGLIFVGAEAGHLPWRAAEVGAIAIAACLILENRWTMPLLGHIGACLAPATTIAVLHATLPRQQATWGALLATEAIGLTLIRSARRPAVGLAAGLAILFLAVFSPLTAPAHAATFALLAIVAVLQSHQLRTEILAWVGSAALLMSLGHWLYVQPTPPLPLAIPMVFLIHATILLPGLLVRRFPNLAMIGRALGNSAKVSSLIAVGALAFYPDPANLTWLTVGAGWVALTWLAFALVESQAAWYSASQAATTIAAVLGISAALRSVGLESQILGSLDLCALALTGLVAIWTGVRFFWRHPIWDDADWPAFERVMLGGLIGVTTALTILRVAPNVIFELSSSGEVVNSIQPFWRIPGGEWLVLGALAIVLAVQFWVIDRTWQHALALTGMLTIYLVIPALAATYFNNRMASASALRWGLGAACLLGCVPFWRRDSIAGNAKRLGIRISDPDYWNRVAVIAGLRFALLAVAGGVPLLLTLVTMGELIAGYSPAGPAAGTIFHKLGFTWSHGLPLALVAAGMVGHALRDRSSEYAFGAGSLFEFLVCGGFLVAAATAHRPFDRFVWIEMGQRFAIVAGAWAIGWLMVSRWLGQFQNDDRPWHEKPSVWWNAQFALTAISTLAPLLFAATFIATIRNPPPWIVAISAWPEWLALILTLVALDVRSQFAGKDHAAPIIGVGAMAAAMLLAASIPLGWHGWAFRTLLLGWAGCAIVWAVLTHWKRTHELQGGLAAATVLAILLALKDLLVHAEPNWLLRTPAPLAIGLTAAAMAIFRSEDQRIRQNLATIGLSLVVAALAAFGVAVVPPETSALWLHRTVADLAALSIGTLVYAFAGRRTGRWAIAANEIAPSLGLVAAGVLVLSVVQQGFLFDVKSMQTPLHGAEVAVLVLATIALMAAAIAFAVRPEIDPFQVPDRWRSGYVYATEVLLVMLFLHLRFNVPRIFPRIEAQAWAFVIMAIAFIGVGLSELSRRLRLEVFVHPLQRTGLFLPLLPLLMFWMKPPEALREPIISVFPGSKPLLGFFDQIPTDFGNYSILWFLFGLLYAWLAISRQSFRHALFAALAANVGIWSLLWHGGISLAAHPQLWLVPLALIILVSEQYQHARIRRDFSLGLRYAGLGLLYLSSTADFFLAGLGNSVLLPLALALLSIAGVLIGILLRIRSYLFLGTGFLALVVFSMIWHAAVDLSQTWLWWVSGIVLGIAILALFALFEKRRQAVVHAIDELRAWR